LSGQSSQILENAKVNQAIQTRTQDEQRLLVELVRGEKDKPMPNSIQAQARAQERLLGYLIALAGRPPSERQAALCLIAVLEWAELLTGPDQVRIQDVRRRLDDLRAPTTTSKPSSIT
jgi:hypothetical protein